MLDSSGLEGPSLLLPLFLVLTAYVGGELSLGFNLDLM